MTQALDAITVTALELEAGRECTLLASQPHPYPVLLSHFEVTELSPQDCFAQLVDLRIERLSYLIAPVSLGMLEGEQRLKYRRAEQQALERMPSVARLLGPQRVLQLIKPDRRIVRLTALDVRWNPQQHLTLALKNFGPLTIDKVSIELALYTFGGPLLSFN